MNREKILKQVIETTAKKLFFQPSEITEQSYFGAEKKNSPPGHYLNADSLEKIELIIDLERDFGIYVPNDHIDSLQQIGQVVDYIQKTMADKCQ